MSAHTAAYDDDVKVVVAAFRCIERSSSTKQRSWREGRGWCREEEERVGEEEFHGY